MESTSATKGFRQTALGLILATAAACAPALTLDVNTGLMPTSQSFSLVVNSAGGADVLNFPLRGYVSLDGDHYWIDIFHLALNGTEIFSGTFDMGGSGANRILFNPNGGTADPMTFGFYAGGLTQISIPLTWQAGQNTLVFSYESPLFFEGSARAGPQPIEDEGWGIGPIPEPQTYALMLAGLAVVGALARRRGALTH